MSIMCGFSSDTVVIDLGYAKTDCFSEYRRLRYIFNRRVRLSILCIVGSVMHPYYVEIVSE